MPNTSLSIVFGIAITWKALAVQPLRIAEGVVAADRDQRVDLRCARFFSTCGVKSSLDSWIVRMMGLTQEVRHVCGRDPARIGTGRVQKGAPVPVDRAGVRLVERHDQVLRPLEVVDVIVEEAAPTSSDADHLMARIRNVINRRLDVGVRPGTSPPPVKMPILLIAITRASPRTLWGADGDVAGSRPILSPAAQRAATYVRGSVGRIGQPYIQGNASGSDSSPGRAHSQPDRRDDSGQGWGGPHPDYRHSKRAAQSLQCSQHRRGLRRRPIPLEGDAAHESGKEELRGHWHDLDQRGCGRDPASSAARGFVYVPESDAMGIKIVRHRFDLRFSPKEKRAILTDQLTLENRGAQTGAFVFRMSPSYVVQSIERGGKRIPFDETGGVVMAPRPQGRATYTIRYSGVVDLPGYAGSISEKEATLTNDYWYPMIARQPAPYDIDIHTPKSWVAVGQGEKLAESSTASERITRFRMDTPIVYYSMSAGPFRVGIDHINGKEYRCWSLRMSLEQLKIQGYLFAPVIEFYEKSFGKLPFSGYGAVDSDVYAVGAMEAYSYATYGAAYPPRTRTSPPIPGGAAFSTTRTSARSGTRASPISPTGSITAMPRSAAARIGASRSSNLQALPPHTTVAPSRAAAPLAARLEARWAMARARWCCRCSNSSWEPTT